VIASSSEVYQTPPSIPTSEVVPLVIPDVANPRYSYGGGKILCELIAHNYCRSDFDRVTIFRPHNVYGPDMGWEHVIPQFALRGIQLRDTPLHPKLFHIKGDGMQTRSFIYINDFIEGLIAVITKGEHMQTYNIGTTEQISIGELAYQVCNHFGLEVQLVPSNAPIGETSIRCPDITRLQGLGFRPTTTLSEGLSTTLAWYDANVDLRPP
jgi:dTDP-glucose 4,6-dehydratase/UDP-glucose 4-epimerase